MRDVIAGWLDPSNDTFEITQTAVMTDFQTTPAFVSARKNHYRAAARADHLPRISALAELRQPLDLLRIAERDERAKPP